jgi:hypothetical protein
MPPSQPALRAIRRQKKPWHPGDPVPEKSRTELGLPAIKRKPCVEVVEPELPKPKRIARDLFTDASQRQALIEYEVRRMRTAGVFDVLPSDINVNQTSIDRNFTQGEFEAICWFSRLHAIVTGGRFAPQQAGDRNALAEYAHTLERLPEPYVVILDWVARVKYPDCFRNLDEEMPGKVQMAKMMFAATDEKYLRGGIDGFFKAVCQLIAHVRITRRIELDRRKLVREEYTAPRIPRSFKL